MNNKNLLQIWIIISLMFFSATVSSCSEPAEARIIEAENPTVQPGLTAELKYRIVFSDDPAILPGRKEIKLFSQLPVVGLSDQAFRILSAEPDCSSSGISLSVIIRADNDLLSGETAELEISWAGITAYSVVEVKKDPQNFIDADGIITDPAAYDSMINKVHRLPADYIPEDLIRVEVPTILVFEEVNHLRRAVSEALSAMFTAAETEKGFELLARSGYRSYKTQVMLYESNLREHGEDYASRFSAKPGTSEHQSGLVMDISSPVVGNQLTQDFGDTEEGRWVAENAHRFGFIVRYPRGKEDITGYSYEPWHLRWVGRTLAERIYSAGLTLEEYFTE